MTREQTSSFCSAIKGGESKTYLSESILFTSVYLMSSPGLLPSGGTLTLFSSSKNFMHGRLFITQIILPL